MFENSLPKLGIISSFGQYWLATTDRGMGLPRAGILLKLAQRKLLERDWEEAMMQVDWKILQEREEKNAVRFGT
jgi:hypothetical protein